MKVEYANEIVAFIESDCKLKLEKAIKKTLGVKVNLEFNIDRLYNGDNYIKVVDTLSDVDEKMRANAILKQLFDSAELRVDVWPIQNDEGETLAVSFNIGVSYKHNFHGGNNGHDLMVYCYDRITGEERIIA